MGVTIYEDAQDGLTLGWYIYDDDPPGATITNVDDGTGNRAIQLAGDGTVNGYRLRLENGNNWNNATQFIAQWRMKYDENFTVYFYCDTTDGNRYLTYNPATSDNLGNGEYVHHGLGSSACNGTWQIFTRDLEADLQEAQPDNDLLEVNGFWIRGSGLVDDIRLYDNFFNWPLLTAQNKLQGMRGING